MNKDYLKNEGNALKIQKHQLNQSENKLVEIDNVLSNIQSKQEEDNVSLDDMLSDMEALLEATDNNISTYSDNDILSIEKQLEVTINPEELTVVDELDKVNFDDGMSWEEYMCSIEEYGFKHNLDLKDDPFKSLMTKSQQVELQKRIKDEFTLKNAQCDKYDYMIAGTCGVIAGLVDILFVGAPGDSKLGDIADEQANKITEKFAGFLGWDKDKAVEKGSNTTASAIGYLEKKFKINYDHATTHATGGVVKNLSLKNHHLKGLGHSPDIIGLIFSVLNQFTNTASFISNGQIITIETEEFELQGHNFIAKIFCGVANWFGHIMSDWTGSSGTVGQGGRGTGVPIPFYNLFQMINIGEFGQHKQSFATITTKVFEEGYDTRHAMAMAVPVLINELLIRFMYTMKARFYHNKEWKDCIPKGSVPEVRRMLLVGHGVLCIIDGADAYIRSGSGADMVAFLSRTNLLAWTRFGQLALKEVYAWYNSGHIDADAVDEYLNKELKNMLKNNI
ncbi:hypothetical protein [Sulfurimonas xiamenensis]|uniref:Uncharacterized protein n=1 Tax=Sulfurimonas xiamenensis TaxID=2590021 RepID=A0AAJ4A2R1_9BACT|nr:hypothetical protein [Sulfurimonas xiamenensis]QFR42826.1 hypothetical protein FJR47_02425 [Sulfurimonas xiamenensis]